MEEERKERECSFEDPPLNGNDPKLLFLSLDIFS
jgi:hypothetical protein